MSKKTKWDSFYKITRFAVNVLIVWSLIYSISGSIELYKWGNQKQWTKDCVENSGLGGVYCGFGYDNAKANYIKQINEGLIYAAFLIFVFYGPVMLVKFFSVKNDKSKPRRSS